ncbi:MAG: hypothetical protein ACFB51_15260 [Anaerolineae bacterium]
MILSDNPVFRFEAARDQSAHWSRTLRYGCTLILLAALVLVLTAVVTVTTLANIAYSLEELVINLLVVSVLVLVALQILAGMGLGILTVAQAAPAISSEVEMQSWSMLRTTALSLGQILAGKFAAVYARLRTPLISILVLRLITVLTGLLLGAVLIMRDQVYWIHAGAWDRFWISGAWQPFVFAVPVVIIYYIGQPLLQFVVNTALGLFYSAHNRQRVRALTASIASRLVLWVLMLVVNGLAIYGLVLLVDEWSYAYWAPQLYVQLPTTTTILWAIGSVLFVWIAVQLAWQAGLALFTMALTYRRARYLAD